MPFLTRWLLAVAAVGSASRPAAADPPPGRVPLTTSRFVGSPDPPPPFRVVNAFPKLRFDHPLHFAAAPGSDRLFVCEEGGKVWSFPNRPDAAADLALDVPAALAAGFPTGAKFDTLFALAFHPRFAENRRCYVCYAVRDKAGKPNLDDGTRVSRFTVAAGGPPRIDPASEEVLLTWRQGGHNGCDLQFGPDGMLYVSAGDSEVPTPPDPLHTGQDITDLMSSILRIDVDRADPGKAYAIPKDNPFVGMTVRGKPTRGEVWAYGLRNPWRMSFDRATGDLWVGDVGWELWEMVYKVERGGNYGWSLAEARQPIHTADPPGPTPVTPPLIELPHTVATSVTGGFVYRGRKFPELVGAYIFGDWGTRRMWAYGRQTVGGSGKPKPSSPSTSSLPTGTDTDTGTFRLQELTAPSVQVIAFGQDRAGELYVLDYDTGAVLTWERNPDAGKPATDFPKALSASGLFTSVRDHAVAPGVYGFAVNAPQWQDGATAERFVALPGTSAVTHHEPKKTIPGHASWVTAAFNFPENGALLKTLSLETEVGNPATRRRVETQVLHWDGRAWNAYSYLWRDDQTDADLVPADGAEKHFAVADPRHAAGTRDQTWAFAPRTQCLTCHNPRAEYAIGFAPDQLNRGDQLARFGGLGLIRWAGRGEQPLPAPTAADAGKLRKLADPGDPAAPLADRARAYLHANCAHCHRPGGGGSVEFEAVAFADPARLKAIDVPPKQGGFGLPDARIVAPGEPDRSALLYRMAKVGRGRMPHFGSEVVDDKGVSLIQRWIAGLKGARGEGSSPDGVALDPAGIETRLGSPAGALGLACAVRSDGCPPEVRRRVLAAAAKLPPGEVRDLFAGDLPRVGDPKLGPAPRPRAVLGLTGDAARGRALFLAERTQCVRCHKIDGQGKEVGPDLSAVGARTREEVLESLLDPSRRVDAKYQSYLVRTADGRALTGLMVRRDAAEVVLKDADGKEVRVAAGDVEAVVPARESLMPAGLLADLTAQQAADLVEFLASFRPRK